jgi:hypothetical protein
MKTTVSALVFSGAMLFASAQIGAASHPCAEQSDPQARLVCYDAAFPPLTAEPAQIESEEEIEQRVREDFGLGSSEIQRRRPELATDPEIEDIAAAVTRVSSLPGGQRLVVLDNGQSWRVIEGSSRGPLRNGDSITITRAALGSFRLITPAGVGLRVRRAQ